VVHYGYSTTQDTGFINADTLVEAILERFAKTASQKVFQNILIVLTKTAKMRNNRWKPALTRKAKGKRIKIRAGYSPASEEAVCHRRSIN